jgi:hypothetical protein
MPNGALFVDYAMPDGSTRPAIVVRDWTADCASIQVFSDPRNDGQDPYGAGWFRSSCSRGTAPGTWRERPLVFSGVLPSVAGPAIWAAPAKQCTCATTWHGTTARPPCPEHGFGTKIEVKGSAPTVFEQPSGGYPR